MKKIILFCLLLLGVSFPQSEFTVELNRTYCDWVGAAAFFDSVQTIIINNSTGDTVSTDSVYYIYHAKTYYPTGPLEHIDSSLGLNKFGRDNDNNFIQTWYVIVTDSSVNRSFSNLNSDTVSFQIETEPFKAKLFTFQAKKTDESSQSGADVAHWMYVVDQWNPEFNNYLTLNHDETLKPSPNFISGDNVKFYHWFSNTLDSNLLNIKTIYVDTNTSSSLIDYYNNSYAGITIKNSVPGFTGDSIGFSDPWLQDQNTIYGLQNQGTNAPIKNVSSPFNPNFSSDYKGVFLGQDPAQTAAYYSIGTPPVKKLNGYTAFFSGWAASPSDSVNFVDGASSDTTAVVFYGRNVTITANYSYTTLTYNTTMPSGTWPTQGTVTVPSGITLTVNSGSTVQFPTGSGLTINGELTTDGGTFTHTSGTWNGITFNSAEGSSLSNDTISYASSPIVINTTDDITISGCTLNNSTFYNGNSTTAAAIQVYGSTPYITNTKIEGESGSWSGVRFQSSSGGSLTNCTIENLGDGNGVIIQGGSNPSISSNTITNNHYHNITVVDNGTAQPDILSNTISYSTNYNGIVFDNSTGVVRYNTVSNNYNAGIISTDYATINAWAVTGDEGGNQVYDNYDGIFAGAGGTINFGQWRTLTAICNGIYDNTRYNAFSGTGCYVYASYNWWGASSPDTSKIKANGSLTYDYPLSTSDGCPGGGSSASPITMETISSANPGDSLAANSDVEQKLQNALEDNIDGNYSNALTLCRSVLNDNSASSYYKKTIGILYQVYQATGDKSIADDLEKLASNNGDLGTTASLLLSSIYESTGKIAEAENIATSLKNANPNSDIGMRALIRLATLSAYNPKFSSISKSAVNELATNYSNSVDKGLLAALGGVVPAEVSKQNNQSEAEGNETKTDTLTFSLANYPNPFNPTTIIHYVLPKAGFVSLKIYDMLGREVKTLVSENKDKGVYNVTFNASNLASGVYIYQLRSGNFVASKKLLLMK